MYSRSWFIKNYPYMKASVIILIYFPDPMRTLNPSNMSTTVLRKTFHTLFFSLGACLLFCSQTHGARTTGKLPEGVAAIVGTHKIYEQQLQPETQSPDLNTAFADSLALRKLETLIKKQLCSILFAQENIKVDPKKLADTIKHFEQNPPECSCQLLHNDLGEYLKTHMYTLDEFISQQRMDMGLDMVIEKHWEKLYPDKQAVNNLIREKQGKIEKLYFKASVLKLSQTGSKTQADRIYERLCQSANFKAQCKQIAQNDNQMEFTPDKMFFKSAGDSQLAQTISFMPYEQISQPVLLGSGYNIIRKEQLTRQDILDIIRSGFFRNSKKSILRQLENETDIVISEKYSGPLNM